MVALAIDYRTRASGRSFYGILVLALIYVAVNGDTRMGAQRWMTIWKFSLQPSEFGRLIWRSCWRRSMVRAAGRRTPSDLAIGAVALGLPLLLILKQPDLGTAVTLVPVYLGVVFLGGMRLKWLAIGRWPCWCRLSSGRLS